MPNGDVSGDGNFLQQKLGGIPMWVFLAIAGVLVWYFFFHKSGLPAASTSGGGGSVRTGNVNVAKGAVQITVDQGAGSDHQEQPGPPNPPGLKLKAITVNKDETLEQLADYRHWTSETLGDVEKLTQPKGSSYAGKQLSANQQLRKGQIIYRPIGENAAEEAF